MERLIQIKTWKYSQIIKRIITKTCKEQFKCDSIKQKSIVCVPEDKVI